MVVDIDFLFMWIGYLDAGNPSNHESVIRSDVRPCKSYLFQSFDQLPSRYGTSLFDNRNWLLGEVDRMNHLSRGLDGLTGFPKIPILQ
jgi:hypothetical protein